MKVYGSEVSLLLPARVREMVLTCRRRERRVPVRLMQMLSREERFWVFTKVKSRGCWLWLGSKNGKGYGRLKWAGTWLQAHRLSYEIHHGKVPLDRIIMHSCDNGMCVQPEHLSVATHADNAADRESKGRGVRPRRPSPNRLQR